MEITECIFRKQNQNRIVLRTEALFWDNAFRWICSRWLEPIAHGSIATTFARYLNMTKKSSMTKYLFLQRQRNSITLFIRARELQKGHFCWSIKNLSEKLSWAENLKTSLNEKFLKRAEEEQNLNPVWDEIKPLCSLKDLLLSLCFLNVKTTLLRDLNILFLFLWT